IVGALENGGLQDLLEHFLGQKAQPILGLPFIVAVEKIVEGLAAVLIERPEQGHRDQGPGGLLERPPRCGLVERVVGEGMHDVGANERPVDVVEGGGGGTRFVHDPSSLRHVALQVNASVDAQRRADRHRPGGPTNRPPAALAEQGFARQGAPDPNPPPRRSRPNAATTIPATSTHTAPSPITPKQPHPSPPPPPTPAPQ